MEKPEFRKKRNERQYEYFKQYVKANQIVVRAYLETHPCVDCGITDWRVLEFDHVRGEKYMDIAKLMRVSSNIDKLMEEIAKCDVRCANCHRLKTIERSGQWRYTEVEVAT